MNQTTLTLDEVQAFDPHGGSGGERLRYCCPLCGQDKPKDAAHRTLTLDASQGFWNCFRCGNKGKLGKSNYYVAPAPKPQQPRQTWKEIWDESGVVLLRESKPAVNYLSTRRIDLRCFCDSNLSFAMRFYRRPAILFPISDADGSTVAFQGRYIDKGFPKCRTAGRKSLGVYSMVEARGANEIAICEAPLDALSFWQMFRIPAVAVCGSDALPLWFSRSLRGKRVLVAADADEAGDRAALRWAEDLRGIAYEVLRRRPKGAKDWNEMLGGK